MTENEISFKIRGVIFDVYYMLGPGLFEHVYEEVMAFKLEKAALRVRTQVALPVVVEGVSLPAGYRLDLLVEDKVIVEIKSVENLGEVHHKQLITYLKLSDKKLGLLVNFNTAEIKKSIFRKVNGLDRGFPSEKANFSER